MADTQWEFIIEKYTEEEFDTIRKSKDANYVIMAQMNREDQDGHDLHGYVEFSYTVDPAMITTLDGFERAMMIMVLEYPEDCADRYKEEALWTERGIRSDVIAAMAKHIGGTETDDVTALYKKYGASFFTAWKAEREKEKARVNAMKVNNFVLKPWQEDVVSLLEQQNQDTILYVEAPEQAGKTALANYLRRTKGAYMASNSLTRSIRKNYHRQEYVVIDSQTGHSPDDVLVELKNGKMHDTTKVKTMPIPPKILVMSRGFNPPRLIAGHRCRHQNTVKKVVDGTLIQ